MEHGQDRKLSSPLSSLPAANRTRVEPCSELLIYSVPYLLKYTGVPLLRMYVLRASESTSSPGGGETLRSK